MSARRTGRRGPPTALAALALLLAACSASERPGIPPRHVILVTMASVRPDHMSCFNYFRPTTLWEVDPGMRGVGEGKAIDDLAAEGVLFARAYTPSPLTLPAAAALLTGRSPLETGLIDAGGELAEEELTIAEAFREGGFRTVAFLSGDALPVESGVVQGFELVERGNDDLQTMDRAVEWIGEADLGNWKPLLVWVHLDGPSIPYDPQMLGPRPGGEPGEVDYGQLYVDPAYDGPADGSRAWLESLSTGAVTPGPRDLDHVVSLYDGEIARTNSALRTFLDRFQEAGEQIGMWEQTVMVFAGLHGEALGGHEARFGNERSMHESVLHVPLFLRHPQSMTGQRILVARVDLTDVLPTLIEWFGLRSSVPDGGRSLLALTDSYVERRFAERSPLAVWSGPALSLREERWRLTWNGAAQEEGGPLPRREWSLFDMERDGPDGAECSARHPEEVERLRAVLLRRFGELDALSRVDFSP